MRPSPTVVVLAKTPVPGLVKTRLCPPLSPVSAAWLAAAALRDTLDVVSAVPGVRRVLALDGRPGPWIPSVFDVVAQPPGGLDVRIAAALAATTGPTVVIGMDTPQLRPADLELAFATLEHRASAVVGPARDGGYWLLGLRRPDPQAVLGVPMSVDETGAAQIARLRSLGLTVSLLHELRDVDRFADARSVVRAAPASRFARAVEALAAVGAVDGP